MLPCLRPPCRRHRHRLRRTPCRLFLSRILRHLRLGRPEPFPLARRHRSRDKDFHPNGARPHAFCLHLRCEGVLLAFSAPIGGALPRQRHCGHAQRRLEPHRLGRHRFEDVRPHERSRATAPQIWPTPFSRQPLRRRAPSPACAMSSAPMPKAGCLLTKCSASQQGQRLSRPFEADYTFWR